MEKMKQEIYTFTDRLEECLDAMASGEEIRIAGIARTPCGIRSMRGCGER